MFYLIAGVPRSGKSSFARILAQRLGITKIDFDDITTLFQEFIPEHGLSMDMDQTKREEVSLPIMQSLIKRYSDTEQDLIIEGDNISLNDYESYQEMTKGNLKILVFGYHNITPEQKIEINTKAVREKDIHCWLEVLEYSDKLRIAKEFIERSKVLDSEVKDINSPEKVRYFNTHNNFDTEMQNALDFCLSN